MKNKKIELTKEKRDYMVSAIRNYFLNERDENIGDLASAMLLDFFMDELAAEIYNQGVFDSYVYMNDRCEDLLSIQK